MTTSNDDIVRISADSHFQEPADLWSTRLPRALRDQAPRWEEIDDGMTLFHAEGEAMVAVRTPRRPDGSSPYDPRDVADHAELDLRMRDLDLDGVWAEVLYPNNGGFVNGIADGDLAMACARVYNDFAAEVFGAHRDRFCPAALIPVQHSVEASVAELEHSVGLGHRAFQLPMQAPPELPWFLAYWEPLWAAAEANGVPVSFHVGPAPGRQLNPAMLQAMSASAEGLSADEFRGSALSSPIAAVGAMVTLGSLLGSGVLHRHPDLQVVLVEVGAGWLAHAVEVWDNTQNDWGEGGAGEPRLYAPLYDAEGKRSLSPLRRADWRFPMLPSDYVRRQAHVTFMDERAGVNNVGITGVEAVMWGSDYPHDEGTFPNSRKVTEELFDGVDKDVARAVLGGTTSRLFGLAYPE